MKVGALALAVLLTMLLKLIGLNKHLDRQWSKIYIYIYNAVPISGRSIDRYWDTVTWVIVELTSEPRRERSVIVAVAATKLGK